MRSSQPSRGVNAGAHYANHFSDFYGQDQRPDSFVDQRPQYDGGDPSFPHEQDYQEVFQGGGGEYFLQQDQPADELYGQTTQQVYTGQPQMPTTGSHGFIQPGFDGFHPQHRPESGAYGREEMQPMNKPLPFNPSTQMEIGGYRAEDYYAMPQARDQYQTYDRIQRQLDQNQELLQYGKGPRARSQSGYPTEPTGPSAPPKLKIKKVKKKSKSKKKQALRKAKYQGDLGSSEPYFEQSDTIRIDEIEELLNTSLPHLPPQQIVDEANPFRTQSSFAHMPQYSRPVLGNFVQPEFGDERYGQEDFDSGRPFEDFDHQIGDEAEEQMMGMQPVSNQPMIPSQYPQMHQPPAHFSMQPQYPSGQQQPQQQPLYEQHNFFPSPMQHYYATVSNQPTDERLPNHPTSMATSSYAGHPSQYWPEYDPREPQQQVWNKAPYDQQQAQPRPQKQFIKRSPEQVSPTNQPKSKPPLPQPHDPAPERQAQTLPPKGGGAQRQQRGADSSQTRNQNQVRITSGSPMKQQKKLELVRQNSDRKRRQADYSRSPQHSPRQMPQNTNHPERSARTYGLPRQLSGDDHQIYGRPNPMMNSHDRPRRRSHHRNSPRGQGPTMVGGMHVVNASTQSQINRHSVVSSSGSTCDRPAIRVTDNQQLSRGSSSNPSESSELLETERTEEEDLDRESQQESPQENARAPHQIQFSSSLNNRNLDLEAIPQHQRTNDIRTSSHRRDEEEKHPSISDHRNEANYKRTKTNDLSNKQSSSGGTPSIPAQRSLATGSRQNSSHELLPGKQPSGGRHERGNNQGSSDNHSHNNNDSRPSMGINQPQITTRSMPKPPPKGVVTDDSGNGRPRSLVPENPFQLANTSDFIGDHPKDSYQSLPGKELSPEILRNSNLPSPETEEAQVLKESETAEFKPAANKLHKEFTLGASKKKQSSKSSDSSSSRSRVVTDSPKVFALNTDSNHARAEKRTNSFEIGMLSQEINTPFSQNLASNTSRASESHAKIQYMRSKTNKDNSNVETLEAFPKSQDKMNFSVGEKNSPQNSSKKNTSPRAVAGKVTNVTPTVGQIDEVETLAVDKFQDIEINRSIASERKKQKEESKTEEFKAKPEKVAMDSDLPKPAAPVISFDLPDPFFSYILKARTHFLEMEEEEDQEELGIIRQKMKFSPPKKEELPSQPSQASVPSQLPQKEELGSDVPIEQPVPIEPAKQVADPEEKPAEELKQGGPDAQAAESKAEEETIEVKEEPETILIINQAEEPKEVEAAASKEEAPPQVESSAEQEPAANKANDPGSQPVTSEIPVPEVEKEALVEAKEEKPSELIQPSEPIVPTEQKAVVEKQEPSSIEVLAVPVPELAQAPSMQEVSKADGQAQEEVKTASENQVQEDFPKEEPDQITEPVPVEDKKEQLPEEVPPREVVEKASKVDQAPTEIEAVAADALQEKEAIIADKLALPENEILVDPGSSGAGILLKKEEPSLSTPGLETEKTPPATAPVLAQQADTFESKALSAMAKMPPALPVPGTEPSVREPPPLFTDADHPQTPTNMISKLSEALSQTEEIKRESDGEEPPLALTQPEMKDSMPSLRLHFDSTRRQLPVNQNQSYLNISNTLAGISQIQIELKDTLDISFPTDALALKANFIEAQETWEPFAALAQNDLTIGRVQEEAAELFKKDQLNMSTPNFLSKIDSLKAAPLEMKPASGLRYYKIDPSTIKSEDTERKNNEHQDVLKEFSIVHILYEMNGNHPLECQIDTYYNELTEISSWISKIHSVAGASLIFSQDKVKKKAQIKKENRGARKARKKEKLRLSKLHRAISDQKMVRGPGSGIGSGDKDKEKSSEILGESILRSPSVQVGPALLSGRLQTPRSRSRRPSASNFASKKDAYGVHRKTSKGELGKQQLSPKDDLITSLGSIQGNFESTISKRKMTEIHTLADDPFKIRQRTMKNDDSDGKLRCSTPYSMSRQRPTKAMPLSILTGSQDDKKLAGTETQTKPKNKSPFLNPISEASGNQPSSGLMRKKTGGVNLLKSGISGEPKIEVPSRRDTSSEDESDYDSEGCEEEEEQGDDSYFTEANRKSSAFDQFQYAYNGDGNFDLYKNFVDPENMQNYFEDGGSEYGEAQAEASLSLISLDNPMNDPEKRIAEAPMFYDSKSERMTYSIIKVPDLDSKEATFVASFQKMKTDQIKLRTNSFLHTAQQDMAKWADLVTQSNKQTGPHDFEVHKDLEYLVQHREHFLFVKENMESKFDMLKFNRFQKLKSQMSFFNINVNQVMQKAEIIIINQGETTMQSRIDLAKSSACPYFRKKKKGGPESINQASLYLFSYNLLPQTILKVEQAVSLTQEKLDMNPLPSLKKSLSTQPTLGRSKPKPEQSKFYELRKLQKKDDDGEDIPAGSLSHRQYPPEKESSTIQSRLESIGLHMLATRENNEQFINIFKAESFCCSQFFMKKTQSLIYYQVTKVMNKIQESYYYELINGPLDKYEFHAKRVQDMRTQFFKRDLPEVSIDLHSQQYAMVYHRTMHQTIKNQLVVQNRTANQIRDMIFQSDTFLVRHMLRMAYSEKLLLKKIKELFVSGYRKEKGQIKNPDLIELVDRNSDSDSTSSSKDNDEVSTFFEKTTNSLNLGSDGMSKAIKVFENVKKKENDLSDKMAKSFKPKQAFDGLLQKANRKKKDRKKQKEMIKLDYNVFRVIYAKTDAEEQAIDQNTMSRKLPSILEDTQTLKRMRSDADLDSSANNLSMMNIDPQGETSSTESDFEEEKTKFQLSLKFGYGQYTLHNGMYDVFMTELYETSLKKQERMKQRKQNREQKRQVKREQSKKNKIKMQLMGIGLSILNRIKQEKKTRKVEVKKNLNNFDIRRGEKGETIAIPKVLNEQKERQNHGVAGATIPALRFGKIPKMEESKSEGGASDHFISPSVKASILNLDSILNQDLSPAERIRRSSRDYTKEQADSTFGEAIAGVNGSAGKKPPRKFSSTKNQSDLLAIPTTEEEKPTLADVVESPRSHSSPASHQGTEDFWRQHNTHLEPIEEVEAKLEEDEGNHGLRSRSLGPPKKMQTKNAIKFTSQFSFGNGVKRTKRQSHMMLTKKDQSPLRMFQTLLETSPGTSAKTISDFTDRLQQHPGRIEKGQSASPLKLDKLRADSESRAILNFYEVLSDCDPEKRPDTFKSVRHLRISQGSSELEAKIKPIENFIRDIKRDICLDQKMQKKFLQTMERLRNKEQDFKSKPPTKNGKPSRGSFIKRRATIMLPGMSPKINQPIKKVHHDKAQNLKMLRKKSTFSPIITDIDLLRQDKKDDYNHYFITTPIYIEKNESSLNESEGDHFSNTQDEPDSNSEGFLKGKWISVNQVDEMTPQPAKSESAPQNAQSECSSLRTDLSSVRDPFEKFDEFSPREPHLEKRAADSEGSPFNKESGLSSRAYSTFGANQQDLAFPASAEEEEKKAQRRNLDKLKDKLKKKALQDCISGKRIKFYLSNSERQEQANRSHKRMMEKSPLEGLGALFKLGAADDGQMNKKEELIAKKGLPLANKIIDMQEKLSSAILRKSEKLQEYNKVKKAIENNRPQVIYDFVQFNVQMIDMQDKDGNTLLALAVHYGRTEMVETLLKNGADPNKSTYVEKNSPLHLAVNFGLKKIQDLLLEAGADEHAQNANGLIPWEGII